MGAKHLFTDRSYTSALFQLILLSEPFLQRGYGILWERIMTEVAFIAKAAAASQHQLLAGISKCLMTVLTIITLQKNCNC